MRICIPIREKGAERAISQIRRANRMLQKWPDSLLEIWLDVFSSVEIGKILKECERPVVAVCRGPKERGAFQGTEKERIRRLIGALETNGQDSRCAIPSGAKFVDIGGHTSPNLIKLLKKACRQAHAELIISHHFWDKTPLLASLEKLAQKSRALGADVVKIAANAVKWSDNVVLFEFTKRMAEKGIPAIVVGMGEKGKISRIGCPLLGSFLTYVALDSRSRTAPGQITVSELVK